MKRYLLTIAPCLCALITACTSAQNTTSNVLDTVGNETSASYNKVRDMLDVGTPKEKKLTPQPRYCYKTFNDIICYSKPLPGEEYRLVGYQDSHGHAGYTLPAVTHVVPTKDMDPNAEAGTQKTPGPATTTDNANTPPKKQLKEIIFDPADLDPKELVPPKAQ